ncbi:hypothetical protein [Bradyrhizobium sp. CCBAU 051011]|nr:hypothetical protein [Bradyrhizobium sp. CCBAU 051011]
MLQGLRNGKIVNARRGLFGRTFRSKNITAAEKVRKMNDIKA